ncbi:unnamed protein product [Vitrella brassicaformis CCMP3155]|uniref:NHR domain-containing protein n=2 Tax=Vitrella brassicaformis TaxID=1169539 RepID=A0A0G4EII1_VITBC|nr:unnamed protein product [Vitrella brassicaformis CCMP3155]|eukprot:CEL96428.1 unnamed protein product [Vitrella brassicaformis CCMP3155]
MGNTFKREEEAGRKDEALPRKVKRQRSLSLEIDSAKSFKGALQVLGSRKAVIGELMVEEKRLWEDLAKDHRHPNILLARALKRASRRAADRPLPTDSEAAAEPEWKLIFTGPPGYDADSLPPLYRLVDASRPVKKESGPFDIASRMFPVVPGDTEDDEQSETDGGNAQGDAMHDDHVAVADVCPPERIDLNQLTFTGGEAERDALLQEDLMRLLLRRLTQNNSVELVPLDDRIRQHITKKTKTTTGEMDAPDEQHQAWEDVSPDHHSPSRIDIHFREWGTFFEEGSEVPMVDAVRYLMSVEGPYYVLRWAAAREQLVEQLQREDEELKEEIRETAILERDAMHLVQWAKRKSEDTAQKVGLLEAEKGRFIEGHRLQIVKRRRLESLQAAHIEMHKKNLCVKIAQREMPEEGQRWINELEENNSQLRTLIKDLLASNRRFSADIEYLHQISAFMATYFPPDGPPNIPKATMKSLWALPDVPRDTGCRFRNHHRIATLKAMHVSDVGILLFGDGPATVTPQGHYFQLKILAEGAKDRGAGSLGVGMTSVPPLKIPHSKLLHVEDIPQCAVMGYDGHVFHKKWDTVEWDASLFTVGTTIGVLMTTAGELWVLLNGQPYRHVHTKLQSKDLMYAIVHMTGATESIELIPNATPPPDLQPISTILNRRKLAIQHYKRDELYELKTGAARRAAVLRELRRSDEVEGWSVSGASESRQESKSEDAQ